MKVPVRRLYALGLIAMSFGLDSAKAQSVTVYANDFLSSTTSLETLWEPAVSAAISNYITRPTGFGTGSDAFLYHYGVAVGDNVNGKLMRDFVFPSLSGERENYQPLGQGSFFRRVWNAVEYTVVKPSNNSGRSFNWSGLPASFASAGLSNLYQPAEQRTLLATVERAGTNTGGYILGNILLEFTKRKVAEHRLMRVVSKSH